MKQFLFKSFSIIMILKIINRLRSIIFLPVVVKVLGTFEYSIFSQCVVTITFLMPIITLGLRETCIRYISAEKNKSAIAKKFLTICFSFWFIAALTLIIATLFHRLLAELIFSDSRMSKYVLILFALLGIRSSLFLMLSLYRAFKKVWLYAVFQFVQNILEICCVLIFVATNTLTLDLLFYIFIGVEFILFTIAFMHFLLQYGMTIPQFTFIPTFLKYGVPLVFGEALFLVVDLSDRYFIVNMIDLKHAGIYSATYNVARLINFPTQAILFSLFPIFVTLWKRKEWESLRQYINYAIMLYCIISIPASLFLLKTYSFLITKLASEDFVLSGLLVALIVGGFILVGVSYMFHYIVYVSERTHIFPQILIGVALANLIMNFIFIPSWGLVGAALATCISYGCYVIVLTIVSKKIFYWRWPVKFMSVTVACSMLMLGSISMFPCISFLNLVTVCIIALITYAIGWCILGSLFGFNPVVIIKSIMQEKKVSRAEQTETMGFNSV